MLRRLGTLLLAALLWAAAGLAEIPQNPETEAAEQQPLLLQITEDDPAIAYVLVQTAGGVGFLPLPLEGEYTREIRGTDESGSEAVNVIRLTPEGFRMESANCPRQDCIGEGEVTLSNREERILGNLVICLPHQLLLCLVTREEAMQMLGQRP